MEPGSAFSPLPLATRALHHTSRAFEAWERGNNAVLRCGLHIVRGSSAWPHEKCSEAERASQRRKRASAVLQAFDGSSLFEMCWTQYAGESGAQLRIIEATQMPESQVVRLQRRRHAAGIVADFLQGWVLSRCAQARGAHSQLLVRSSRGYARGVPRTTRTVWKPNKLPVKMLVRLVRVHGRAGLRLRKEGRWEEVLHAAYCLWLINPIVLGLMATILLTCDVAIPVVWMKLRSIGAAMADLVERRTKLLGNRY